MKTLSSDAIAAMTDGTAISVGAVKIACGPGDTGPIVTSSLGAGGSGYTVGDIGWIIGASGDATYTVLSVDGGGAVLTFSTTGGRAYSVASGVATSTSTGTGDGAFTINVDSIMPGGDVRVWGGYGTITLDSEDYLGIGDRGLVSVTGAAIGDSEQNVALSLSGVEPELLALFDAPALQRSPAKIWLLTFDGPGTSMLDSQVYAVGRLDTISIDETAGATSTIAAQVETAARGLGRSGQRMRTDADQRLIDSSDGGFKAISFAGKKTLYWGGQKPSSASVLGWTPIPSASAYGDYTGFTF